MCKYTSGSGGLSVVVLGPRIFRVCSTCPLPHTHTLLTHDPQQKEIAHIMLT